MLPQKNRVGTPFFPEVLKASKTFHSEHFYLRSKIDIASKEREARFSAVVSKKIEKGAVGRNKLKRRMRAVLSPIYEQYQPSLNIIFAKKGAQTLSFAAIRAEIEYICTQSSRMK